MAANLETFFNPETIAVVGVSEKPDNLGRIISGNLQAFGFRGIVYEVGPKGGTLFGRRIYRAVSDIPDRVDLAVLLVPARVVPDVLIECGRKGIRHVIIETAGFSEAGPEGAELEIEQPPAHCQCRACGEAFCVDDVFALCPACESHDVRVDADSGIRLEYIEVED